MFLTLPRGVKIACFYAVTVALCRRNAILVILRCLGRSQRRGSEIHAESFAPYGHCAVFSQVPSPSLLSGRMTLFQQDPSAHAPCANMIVEF